MPIFLPIKVDRRYSEDFVSSPRFFDEVFSFEHIYNSALLCKNNVMWKGSVQNYMRNLEYNVSETLYLLEIDKFKFKNTYEFYIYERGKLRHIKSIHIRERVVQKVLCLYCLNPLFHPKFIYDNGASTKNKGLSFAINRMKMMMNRHYRQYGKEGYVLLFDFKDYFGSISHEIALEMIATEVKEDRLMKLIKQSIAIYTTKEQVNGVGIGLGSELSQFIALLFANPIDHLIKDDMGFKNYIRYMDDGWVLARTKEELQTLLVCINEKAEKYQLHLNMKKTRIVPLSKGFTFLKKKVSLEDNGSITINISPKSVTRERQRLKKLKKMMFEGKITMKEIEGSYISWRGFAAQFDSYNTIQNMNNLYKDLFGYIPIDKKTKKKKRKRKRKQRINRLIEMASQVPSQYEDESQRWEGLEMVT